MVLHIRSLDDKTLANRVYTQQKENNWPGLVEETKRICEELKIEDCNSTTLSKAKYKILVMKACHLKNEERLRLKASGLKCERMKSEEYGRKTYVSKKSMEESRNWFRTRFFLQPFAGNYTHDRRFAKSNWLCQCKGDIEQEGHIVSGKCDIYSDLRDKYGDLSEDKNLVEFFKAVLERRDEIEEEDKR